MICKLDIEKAYDHVSWDAFIYLLGRMGFGEKWNGWICSYISTIQLSILVGGSPTCFFNSSWRLRQGDLLYVSFFILVLEVLGLILCLNCNLGENS